MVKGTYLYQLLQDFDANKYVGITGIFGEAT
jgi:hypothetical protein